MATKSRRQGEGSRVGIIGLRSIGQDTFAGIKWSGAGATATGVVQNPRHFLAPITVLLVSISNSAPYPQAP